jgi:hypothetical protein
VEKFDCEKEKRALLYTYQNLRESNVSIVIGYSMIQLCLTSTHSKKRRKKILDFPG